MLKLQLWFVRVILKHLHDLRKLVEPNIAVVKDLLADNIDGRVIYFCDEAARIAKPDTKNKHTPVVACLLFLLK